MYHTQIDIGCTTKMTLVICIYLFVCHCNCTTQSNLIIIWSTWSRGAWILRKRKAPNLYMICVSSANHLLLITHAKFKQICLDYMLAAPWRSGTLPQPIQNKVLACLALRFSVQKSIVQSVIKLDQLIAQYSRVSCLGGGDLIIGHHFVKQTEDSRDASFVQVSLAFFPCIQFLSSFSPVYLICRLTCLPA